MVKTTFATTLAYSAATVGRTDRQLAETDAVAHGVLGKTAGRSTFARLTLRLGALGSTFATPSGNLPTDRRRPPPARRPAPAYFGTQSMVYGA